MITLEVKVVKGAFGLLMPWSAWRGTCTLENEHLTIVSQDKTQSISFGFDNIKRFTFNSNNGLWAIRLKTGEKYVFQTAGALLSATKDKDAAQQLHEAMAALLEKYQVKGSMM